MHTKKSAFRKPFPIRRKGREWAMRLLYEKDVGNDPLSDPMMRDHDDLLRDLEPDAGDRERRKIRAQARSDYEGVLTNLQPIDQIIAENAHNWRIDRMPIVDRNILRVSVYEMLFRGDVPPIVSINEAVDIAKNYGGPESGRFVNGILDHIRLKHFPRDRETNCQCKPADDIAAQ